MSSYRALAVSGTDAGKHEHESESPSIVFPKHHVCGALPGRTRGNPSKDFRRIPTLLSWPEFKSSTHKAPLTPCEVKHSKTHRPLT